MRDNTFQGHIKDTFGHINVSKVVCRPDLNRNME